MLLNAAGGGGVGGNDVAAGCGGIEILSASSPTSASATGRAPCCCEVVGLMASEEGNAGSGRAGDVGVGAFSWGCCGERFNEGREV
jgi:hypothetical protein